MQRGVTSLNLALDDCLGQCANTAIDMVAGREGRKISRVDAAEGLGNALDEFPKSAKTHRPAESGHGREADATHLGDFVNSHAEDRPRVSHDCLGDMP